MSQGTAKHAEFASRFNTACENSDLIPPIRHGKLQAIVSLFADRFDETITIETPRKWQEGLAIPRGKRMVHLAQILGVSPEWLEHGTQGSSAKGGHSTEEGSADAAALLLLGIVRMSQGHAAIPFGKVGVNVEIRMGFEDVEAYATPAKVVGKEVLFYIPPAAQEHVVLPVAFEGMALRLFAVPANTAAGDVSRLTHQIKVRIPISDLVELTSPTAALPFAV